MAISLYDMAVPTGIRMLGQLARVLEKAAAHAEAKGIDAAVLLAGRLAPDMYALAKQVQVASDAAMDAGASLLGVQAPRHEDVERTVPELVARLRRAILFLESLPPAAFEGAEDREVHWRARGGTFATPALPYLRDHALPKLYFHVAMAYAILRHDGVPLGKGDFLGKV